MRALVVGVLTLDAVLLALTELAWATLRIGTVPVPVSALAALVTTPLLVHLADRAAPGTRAVFAPLLGWLVVVVVVGLWSPVGGGVLPADWRTVLLLAAGLLPGAVVAARRRTPAASQRPTEPAAG